MSIDAMKQPVSVDDLAFEFEENPPWRAVDTKRETSTMLKEITEMKERYEHAGLPTAESRFCERFARRMAVSYIYHSNVCESVGTQTYGDTLSAVEEFFAAEGTMAEEESCKKREKKFTETTNTCRALQKIHGFHADMEGTGILIVEQICEVHRILLKGFPKRPGELRCQPEDIVVTDTEDGCYHYLRPELVAVHLDAVIDSHNHRMDALEKKVKNGKITQPEKVTYVIKSAAWLLFNFVNNVHPFLDGNGRICRLLANYVLSLVVPFPVSIYHTCSGKRARCDYLEAIISCRKNPSEGPRQLATMLLESVWEGWKNFFENLHSWNASNLPSIVLSQSTVDRVLEERVRRLCHSDPSIDVNSAITAVRNAVVTANISELQDHQCIHIEVTVSSKNVSLALYP